MPIRHHQSQARHGCGPFACTEAVIFGIAAIVAFAIALILQLAGVDQGNILTVATFTLIGLLCLAVHVVTGWWPARRGT